MSIAEKFEIIVDEVYEKGKKDEYDRFWDTCQRNGERTSYTAGFAGINFNFGNFYPKYDIEPIGSADQFMYNWRTGMGQSSTDKFNVYTSLKERLEECGVTLDTSKATSLINAFSYGTFTELPTIDLTGLTSTAGAVFAYNYNYLKTIEKIIVNENTPISTSMFREDSGLENLTVEGTIGQKGFGVQWSTKLSGASIVSIIEALSTTTSGLTVTLSQTAVNNMVFPITSTRTDAEGNEYTTTYNSWVDLAGDGIEGSPNVGIRPNWKIALL